MIISSIVSGYLKNVKTKIPQLLILGVILIGLILRYGNYRIPSSDSSVIIPDSSLVLSALRQFYPEAFTYRIDADSSHPMPIYGSDQEPLGWMVFTSPYCDDLVGYAGPVPMVVVFNPDMTIKGLALLPNSETEGFIRRIEKKGFFRSWDGMTPAHAATTQVETISGATMSSSAVKKSIQRRMGYLSSLSPDRIDTAKGFRFDAILVWLILMGGLFCWWKPHRTHRYRIGWLGLCCLGLGLVGGSFLSLSLWFGWLNYGITLKTVPWLVTVTLLSIVLPLLTNRGFYCAYLCPYGAAQELVGRLNPKPYRILSRTADRLQLVRRLVLLSILILLFTGIRFDLALVEPFASFIPKSAALITLILGGFFLLVSIFIPRFWCRYLCPTGQLLEFFCNRIRLPFIHSKK